MYYKTVNYNVRALSLEVFNKRNSKSKKESLNQET